MEVLPFINSVPADFQGRELEYIQEIVEFLREYQWLFRCHVVDFFVDNHWKNMSQDWLEPLRSASMADLLDMPSGIYKRDWPSSLQLFVARSRRLTLKREPSAPCLVTAQAQASSPAAAPTTDLPVPFGGSLPVPRPIGRVLAQGMNPKKKHEVARLAALVAAVASATQATLVIDMGAGQGYLSQILSYQYGLHTVAIDSCADHATVVNKRSGRILRHLRNCLARAQASAAAHGQSAEPAAARDKGDGDPSMEGSQARTALSRAGTHEVGGLHPPQGEEGGNPVPNARSQCHSQPRPEELPADGMAGPGKDGGISKAAGAEPALDFSLALRGVHTVTLSIRPTMGGTDLASALQSGLAAAGLATPGAACKDHPKRPSSTASSAPCERGTATVDGASNANAVEADGLPSELVEELTGGGPFLLVGLHACGDLSATMIRMALEWPSVAALVNVSCCYNLLSETAPDDEESLRELRVRRATHLLAEQSAARGASPSAPAAPSAAVVPVANAAAAAPRIPSAHLPHEITVHGHACWVQVENALDAGGALPASAAGGASTAVGATGDHVEGASNGGAARGDGGSGRQPAARCKGVDAPPGVQARDEEGSAPPGFPMSRAVRSSGLFHLGNDARALACQSAEKCYHECPAWAAAKMQHHEFRAVLQLVLWRYCPQLFLDQSLSLAVRRSFRCPHTPPKRSSCQCRANRASVSEVAGATSCKMAGTALCDASCFVDYVRGALTGAGIAEEHVPPSDEIAGIWQNTRDEAGLVAPFWMLRIVLAGVLESLILMDRLLFTWEHGREAANVASQEASRIHAHPGSCSALVPLFDPSQSPRNMALVAWRV